MTVRQPRPPAGRGSRRALDVAGHRRRPQEGAAHRARGIGDQRPVDARQPPGRVEEVRLLRDADQRTGRVEQVDDQKHQNDRDHPCLQRSGDIER